MFRILTFCRTVDTVGQTYLTFLDEIISDLNLAMLEKKSCDCLFCFSDIQLKPKFLFPGFYFFIKINEIFC